MRTFKVESSIENIKLSKFLYAKFPNMPKSVFYKALRNKDIKINGERTSSDVTISAKDVIYVYIDDKLLFNLPKNIDNVYEDENILVVFKPQGLLSNEEHKKKNDENYEPTLEDLVLIKSPNAKICHRLDRNTAGIIIFAKNDTSYREILDGFKNKSINKNYLALVYGIFSKKHGVLENYILYDKKNGYSKIYEKQIKGSEKAVTEYTVINENKTLNISELDIVLHTGKMHQIRAQLSSILHPIIGDSKYGKNDINKKFKKYKQMLIAYKYSFNFNEDSFLYYLNSVTVNIKNEYITRILDIESR